MEPLPIDHILPEVVSGLRASNAIVIRAEPGAGKTTRVPPAILDAGLAVLSDKRCGQIVVLQPRRVAARAAASRMSQERGTALGAETGYRVRHEAKATAATRVLFCTVGVFLRRLQNDPVIEDVAVVVFDEFHERSVESDLAFALTRQVQQEIRPDLRIVVMSATLDSSPITAYLGGCPAIDCPGKTFPVSIEYLPQPVNLPIERLVSDAVTRVFSRTTGDLLVFLPGVGEIHKAEDNLHSLATTHNLDLRPLYGDMPLSEQQSVLQPSSRRKVVLATNVAETSLTIDGVTAVIDSGLARINRFDPSRGFNRLDISRISKASATQRAGRAGRNRPGECLRLWSEREQQMLADFEFPEIERVELSEYILQLIAWGERDVRSFAWFEKPADVAVDRALELLELLGATASGKLTELGRAMSLLPLHPRLARLILEGARLGQPKRAALCAALLSERNPFRSPQDRSLDGRRLDQGSRVVHHTDSDVLEQVRAIEDFSDRNQTECIMGELLSGPAKQILRTSSQLLQSISESSGRKDNKSHSQKTLPSSDKELKMSDETLKVMADESLLKAIMTAFPDRICRRRQTGDSRGVMVGGKGVKLSEQSTVYDSALFVAVDLVDLIRTELSVRRASAVDRSWLPDASITTAIDVAYDASREKVVAKKRTRYYDLVLNETITSIPPEIDPGTALADAVITDFDLASLANAEAVDYLARVECLKEWLPELNWPDFGIDPWRTFLPVWISGCTSIAELRAKPVLDAIKASLTSEQIISVERDAPEHIVLPRGRRAKLTYTQGKPPVLEARIQELFGLAQTPRIARSRIAVMMHLLAPNYRVQQITHDLSSFWQNTYPQVKKELKGRYPKHSWPDNPLRP